MLYNIFKWLFNLTVKGYFRSIYIKGRKNIPEKGPVIFAANHPSAFMDPILLAVQVKRELFFLARGDVFKSKLASAFFSKINMIPVYKPDVSPDDVHKNEMVFKECFSHLKKGATMMIFPEGVSKTERRLRTIKTGISRIGLGAEEQYNFELGVTIVPIGINYSNPHHFRSDVFVNFGKPVVVNEYKEVFLKNQKEGVIQLTERVKLELEKLVIIIEDERLDKLIKQIEILYRSKLRDESKPNKKAQQDFYLSKDIVKAVEHYAKNQPKKMEDFEKRIDAYLHDLKRLNIRDTQIRTSRVSLDFLWKTLFFVFGFPLFAYGYLTNFAPFKIADFVSSKVTVREDFLGSLKMASGMFIFLFLYIIEAVILGLLTHWIWGVIFILSLYPAGLFTIHYIKTYYQTRGTIKYLQLFMRKSDLIASLKTTRKTLVDELEEGKEEFLTFVKDK